jgi:hypothetical protein
LVKNLITSTARIQNSELVFTHIKYGTGNSEFYLYTGTAKLVRIKVGIV